MRKPFLLFLIAGCFIWACEVRIERTEPLTDSNIAIKNFRVSSSIGLIAGDSLWLFANGVAASGDIPLKPGSYSFMIYGKGTQAYNVYPKIKIYLDNTLLGEQQLLPKNAMVGVTFKIEKEGLYKLKIEFDSDGMDSEGNDRDVFIKAISLNDGELSGFTVADIDTVNQSKVPAVNDSVMTIADFQVHDTVGKWEENSVIHMMSSGAIESKGSFPMEAGEYDLSIEARGTHAYHVYPKVKVYLDDLMIAEVQLLSNYIRSIVPLKVSKKGLYKIRILFDSDGLDQEGNDRDVFIKSLSLEKKS